jgi:hypothetical protein
MREVLTEGVEFEDVIALRGRFLGLRWERERSVL